jgi:predicted molibdopterin-dependent oxidoreductase YjgC
MRIPHHPILGDETARKEIRITVDGEAVPAYEGEMIAAALGAVGFKRFRVTSKGHDPRGVFCAIGHCTDCAMEVNGRPNVRVCVTPVAPGMVVRTQIGLGAWKNEW